jgi:hypothetical protein
LGERNGDHVTWRELNLALKPLVEDIGEIKADVKAMRSESWLGPRGRDFVTSMGLVGGVIAVLIAVFVR